VHNAAKKLTAAVTAKIAAGEHTSSWPVQCCASNISRVLTDTLKLLFLETPSIMKLSAQWLAQRFSLFAIIKMLCAPNQVCALRYCVFLP